MFYISLKCSQICFNINVLQNDIREFSNTGCRRYSYCEKCVIWISWCFSFSADWPQRSYIVLVDSNWRVHWMKSSNWMMRQCDRQLNLRIEKKFVLWLVHYFTLFSFPKWTPSLEKQIIFDSLNDMKRTILFWRVFLVNLLNAVLLKYWKELTPNRTNPNM